MRQNTIFAVSAAILLTSAGCQHTVKHDPYADVADQTLAQRVRAVSINAHGVDLAEAADCDEAEKAFREALRLDPGLAAARNNLGYLLLTHRKRYYEAAQELRAAARLAPRTVEPRLGLARLYEIVGMPGKSVAQYQYVLTIDPNHAVAAARLAQISTAPGSAVQRSGSDLNRNSLPQIAAEAKAAQLAETN